MDIDVMYKQFFLALILGFLIGFILYLFGIKESGFIGGAFGALISITVYS